MKINELHNQPVQADTYEASMALNQLLKIGNHAVKLHNMIDDSAEMEAWVAKKIDLAGDYVKKVHGYMQGEKAGLYDDGGMTEDAGEGHMSKSTLYHTAKYAIELMQMIKPGDDLEGWVQSKLNKAADYLQGVHNYEEYQKLNPYREELDQNVLVEQAADRQEFLCQGQSLNLFFPAGADKKELHKAHFAAWKLGTKGLYYLRTETSQRAENVSQKVARDALKDFESQAVEAQSQEECVACQG